MIGERTIFWSDVCAFHFGLGVIVSPAKPNLACHEASRAVEFVVHIIAMFQKTNFGVARSQRRTTMIRKDRMLKTYSIEIVSEKYNRGYLYAIMPH